LRNGAADSTLHHAAPIFILADEGFLHNGADTKPDQA
jgi:hypothetical protein